ncbi:recombination regulator RecX [Streptacidiphilus cavernicola]|uniref:Regulatory protein RecX n=1 Tax=Streptacidiphilus cavernicola TaxID=3342716 RepID=A0ABV6W1P3_9ACTN
MPEREAWGPLDWSVNGVGGEGVDLLPADPEPGSGLEQGFDLELDPDSDPEPGPGRRPRSAGEPREQAPEEPRDPVVQAKALCLRLLTGSSKTRKQLADAMRKREIPDEAAEEVLSRFEEVGLIDDAAFADAWVESRHRGRGLARRALAMELRSRGVDHAVVAEAVQRLDPEQETDTARELVRRKLRSTSGLDRQVRLRRLAGMLARRGYPEGLALRVVREALDAERAGDGADEPGGDFWED